MQLFKHLVIIGIATLSIVPVFAADVMNNQSPHTIGNLSCEVTEQTVFYAGAQGINFVDNFTAATNTHWMLSVANSWYSLSNPHNILNVGGFTFASNRKPINIGTIVAVAVNSPASIATTIPNSYTSRADIAAQIIYHVVRAPYGSGPFPQPYYYTPVGGSTQNGTLTRATSSGPIQEDNECHNIHVGFCGDGIVDNSSVQSSSQINTPLAGGEQCDGVGQAQCGAGQSCLNCQCVNDPLNGICSSSYHLTGLYDTTPPYDGSNLQPGAYLCDSGSVVNFSYNSQLQQWTWQCQGLYGGNDASCLAFNSFCGDNVVNPFGGEQCDGNGQAQCASGEECQSCQCVFMPPGVCGSADGQTYYAFFDNGQALNQQSTGLCAPGETVVNWSWNQATHTFSRQCQGVGGPSDVCIATESYCGDGLLGFGIGYTNQEECDDGNTDPFDDCVTYDGSVAVCKLPYCGDGYVQLSLGEACDDGINDGSNGCLDCQLLPAVCGGVDQTAIYDFDNAGDALNINSPGLCSLGVPTQFAYNAATHTWSWVCESPFGGADDVCEAAELWCGDGIVNGSEQCDGSGQAQCGAGQTCQSCTCISDPDDGICGGVNQTAIYDFDNAGDALDINSSGLCANGTVAMFSYNGTTHTWHRQCVGANGGQTDVCEAAELWCGDGIVNGSEQCDGSGQAQCGAGQTCQSCTCISDPDDGICGGVDQTAIYDFDNAGDALDINSSGLCANGTVAMFSYNGTTHTWHRQCVGANGGQTDVCEAVELWCGDGIVNGSEQCDGSGQAQCGAGQTCQSCTCISDPDDSVCWSLSIITSDTYVPTTIGYNCLGEGTVVEVLLRTSAGQTIASSSSANGSFSVTDPDTYTVTCYYDGITSDACEQTATFTSPPSTTTAGTTTAGTTTAGTTTAGTTTAGTTTAGTTTAGTSTAGTSTAGTTTAGTSTAGTTTAGTTTAGTTTAGTSTAGTSTAGTSTAGTSTAGTTTAGTSTAGTSTAGTSTAGTSTATAGGTSGGGTPTSITCGNGKIDKGEVCDDGPLNGTSQSLCTRSCTLKGFGISPRTDESLPPMCAFIDPPSIQLGEILPFWRSVEPNNDILEYSVCNASTTDKIRKSSMMCHFTVRAPDKKTFSFQEPCHTQKLASVGRYEDFQKDINERFASDRGKSFSQSAEWNMSVYGEYTISLDKIVYGICTSSSSGESDTYTMQYMTYDNRVCQFNFPVTTPYLMQKGTVLSSFPDDVRKLEQFRRIDGRSIVDMSNINFLEGSSSLSTFAEMKNIILAFETKAVQRLNVTHPLGGVDAGFRKVPNQEIYVINKGFTLRHDGFKQQFNGGIPTTILVKGNHLVEIVGSLPGNVLLIVPEGTVSFVNENCDVTDSVSATIIAKQVTTSLEIQQANRTLDAKKRCLDGKLVIQGVVITEDRIGLQRIRLMRRSTLNNWFDNSRSKAQAIYAGASLRIEANPGTWSSQPPLSMNHGLFVSKTHQSAGDLLPISPELTALLLSMFLTFSE